MNKQAEMANIAAQHSHPMPSAPPSYDDAMLNKQPPYNPQVMSQMPVGAMPQQPQPVPVVYAVAPPTQVIVPIQVGPRPATLDCPHCHQRVKTVITTDSQKTAHIAALVLCLIGCWFCCCIPYCMDTFKNVHHKCPKCGGFIGTYKH